MTAPTPDFTGLADWLESGPIRWAVDRLEVAAALRHAADLEREVDELRGRVAKAQADRIWGPSDWVFHEGCGTEDHGQRGAYHHKNYHGVNG